MAKIIPIRSALPPDRQGWAFYTLFCDTCAVGDFVRTEDGTASSCGHAASHLNIMLCARCAIIDRRCRRCGASIAGRFTPAKKKRGKPKRR